MKFIELTLKEGICQKTVEFSKIANVIYSQKNAAGKTTFLRALFYALGYPIPSTKGIKFNEMEFLLTLESRNKHFRIFRHDSYMSIDDGTGQIDYSLPTDFYDVLIAITGCENKDVLDNLIGSCYMDQEKGWTLLNRGKVIGNISFNIEALVRGLGGKECDSEILELEAVKRELKKYEYMQSVGKYQEEINEAGEDIEYDAPEEVRDLRIEMLKVEREPLLEELQEIKSILRKNKLLVEYISDFKLAVQSSTGEEIPVTRETLVGFIDNTEFLVARREMLSADLEAVNRKIAALQRQNEKEEYLFKVQTAVEAFDADIKKINVDLVATQRIIDRLKRERQKLQERIRAMTKQNNGVVVELHKCISTYAKELGVSETYVAPNKDYIFTNDLKSLSGSILHKIVFSFKLAFVKLIKEKAGIILPIVLDSPSGREVEHSIVELMLKIIQRDFSDHQLIIATIYEYELRNKTVIEFTDRLFGNTDIMSMN
jgi:hypothetical protein